MTNPTNGSVAGAVEYDAAAVTAADKKVYSHRAKLICGLEGGMPLNMTLPAMCKVRGHLLASVPSDTASIAAVTLGMGDALVPALFANCPRVGWVAGLELIDYVSGEPQACAEKMLRGSTVGRSLQWGVDVLAVTYQWRRREALPSWPTALTRALCRRPGRTGTRSWKRIGGSLP